MDKQIKTKSTDLRNETSKYFWFYLLGIYVTLDWKVANLEVASVRRSPAAFSIGGSQNQLKKGKQWAHT